MPELVDHSIGNFEVNEYEITALLTQQLSDYLHYRIEDERTKGLRFQRMLCGDADEIQRLKDRAEKTLKGVNEALFEFYRAYESDPELEHTNEAIEAYKKARKGDRLVALFEFLKLAPELGFSFSLTGAHHKDELLVPSAADLLLSVSGIQKMDDYKPQVRIIPGSALHEDAVKEINIARSRL
ncbi:hypothetical protein [Marinobacter changyiensis]|uniref:hypothetical protein n=1 Tax=Marinobacter changyiensis TaxID=2604091 RepID=UPI00126477C7|nr:hypothetical protein [Marinobacter changyiensis]